MQNISKIPHTLFDLNVISSTLGKMIHPIFPEKIGSLLPCAILTSQRYCGEPGTRMFQCRSGDSAGLEAPKSHPVSPPQKEHHGDLSGEFFFFLV